MDDKLRETVGELRGLLAAATPGPWGRGHLGEPDIKCECAYVFSDGHAGCIATVCVDNGKLIGDGGNDCPKYDEAVANLSLIVAAVNALPELLDRIEGKEG